MSTAGIKTLVIGMLSIVELRIADTHKIRSIAAKKFPPLNFPRKIPILSRIPVYSIAPATTNTLIKYKYISISNSCTIFSISKPDINIKIRAKEIAMISGERIELGIDTPVVTIESPDYTDQPELYNGNWFINAAEPNDVFVEKYEETFNTEPKVFAGNAYDIVLLLADAFANEEATPVENLLAVKGYIGAMGEVNADSEGTFVTEAIVKQIRNGTSMRAD